MLIKENASIAWLMNIARGKRDMDIGVYAHYKALKVYCGEYIKRHDGCEGCQFYWIGHGCDLHYPMRWGERDEYNGGKTEWNQ